MTNNKKIIEEFYKGFSNLNAGQMIACLSEDIVYNDPLHGILREDEVRNLWRMRCENLSSAEIKILDYNELDHEYITCKWRASFVPQEASKSIQMVMTSFMKLGNGKITEHSDAFKLSDWLAKSYGFKGHLLGWTGWMKKREQSKHRRMLADYAQSA